MIVKGRFIGGGLFEMKEGKDKHSACVVLEGPEDEKAIAELRDAAVAEEFGNKVPKNLQDWTMQTGDDEEYASYGKQFINPKSNQKVPVFVQRNGDRVETSKEEGVVYPGCHVHVAVRALAYRGDEKKGIKPGVTLLLRAVQFWKDGDPLGDRFSSSEFEGCESEFADDAEAQGAVASALI